MSIRLEKALRYCLAKVGRCRLRSPRVLISVHSDITEEQKQTLERAAMAARAKEVYLLESSMATASIEHLRKNHNLVFEKQAAEDVKIKIGTACKPTFKYDRDKGRFRSYLAGQRAVRNSFPQSSERIFRIFLLTPTAGKKGFATASPLLRTTQPRL